MLTVRNIDVKNPWALKMEQFTRFSTDERGRLDLLISAKQRSHAAGKDIIPQGSHSNHCHVLLTGIACRYTMLPDGERQIMAFLVPGDLCDAEIFVLNRMDHSVAAISASTTAMIHADEMKKTLREVSPVAEAVVGHDGRSGRAARADRRSRPPRCDRTSGAPALRNAGPI
ncbi:Crp/Fnr family transcriptional regulator [uncultured Sphingomonas sp.]|uniref:Crp/Fnr family transcriptional regulator n=1 Tax=uncultured Sphingomonas sp. TaxID=158754 RepID=UPI0035CAFB5C